MPNESVAERRVLSAWHAAQQGQLKIAASQLQALVFEFGRTPALRVPREQAYKKLLDVLFLQGRAERLAKVLGQYISDYGEDPDPEFDRSYVSGLVATRTGPNPLRRRTRFRNLLRLLEPTLGLEGCIAECGCFRGLSSHLMCNRLKRHQPTFDGSGYEIYDSFQGLSEPGSEDTEAADTAEAHRIKQNIQRGMYAAPLDHVRAALSAFPAVSFFPGWIPGSFPRTTLNKYRFVHVDVDLYQPTLDSIQYFWPLLVPGGTLVCDDYNWPGARRAVEAFCNSQGIRFDVTSSQQAYFSRHA